MALREVRERFRTARSALFVSLWLVGVGGVGYLLYLLGGGMVRGMGSFASGPAPLLFSASLGRFMLHSLLMVLMTAVVLVVPGQAALAVVGERERGTLHLLQVSQLRPVGIVVGKLASALAYLVLLLLAAVPLLVVPMLFGGVSLGEIGAGLGMILLTALVLGAAGLWVSARARTSRGAVAGAYAVALGLAFGTLLLVGVEAFAGRPPPGSLEPRGGAPIPRDEGREIYTAWLNPYAGMVSAMDEPLRARAELLPSPFGPLRMVLVKRQGFASFMAETIFGSGGTPLEFMGAVQGGVPMGEIMFLERPLAGGWGPETEPLEPIRGPLWVRTVGLYGLLGAAALADASRRVRAPGGRPVVRRRRAPA